MNIRVVLAVTTLIEFIGLGVFLSVWERWGLTDLWYMLLPLGVLLGIAYAENIYSAMEPDLERRPGMLVLILSFWFPLVGLALALVRVYRWLANPSRAG